MSGDQLTDDAASWLAEVRRWCPRRLETILAAENTSMIWTTRPAASALVGPWADI